MTNGPIAPFMLPAVLLVGHVLQPIDHLPVEPLLDGDVRHRRRGRRPVPMLLARREPDDVTRSYLLDRASLPLDPAAADRDDERLPQGVGMPGRPAPGLEGDDVAGRTGRGFRREQRVDADRTAEPLGRSLGRRSRPYSGDIHLLL